MFPREFLPRSMMLTALAAATLAATAVPGGAALAAGDALKPSGQDMLKPSQVNYEGESTNPDNDSGFFVGAGMGFGQARTSSDGATPGLGLLFKAEPGFQINRGSWNRIEASLEIFSGKLAYRLKDDDGGRVEMPIGFGAMAKLGYGYSLGTKMMGVFKFGVGPVLAKYEAHPGDITYSSNGSITGMAGMIGWDMVVPVGGKLDLVGGLGLTHMEFDLGTVKDSSGNKLKGSNASINIPQANLGVRVRL